MTFKYENAFKIGQTIRGYDFQPVEGRYDCYVEGEIIEINMYLECGWFAAYVIKCTKDSYDHAGDCKYSRVGQNIHIPMEIVMEYDGRIVLVENSLMTATQIFAERIEILEAAIEALVEVQDIVPMNPEDVRTTIDMKEILHDALDQAVENKHEE